jgi:hypothetical protein
MALERHTAVAMMDILCVRGKPVRECEMPVSVKDAG